MWKKVLRYLGKYKLPSILSPIMVIGEVFMEVTIPFLMAKILDVGVNGDGGLPYILKIGILMVIMSMVSMCFGVLAGRFAAVAGTGLAKNVRKKIFDKIQDFSFSNVDKFSTASLITRLTTDITYMQNAYMTMIRMLVRSPVMFISALIMATRINARLTLVIFCFIPPLAVVIGLVMSKSFPRFKKMFEKFDKLNSSVQENLIAIRVVKAFVRRDYENEKFVEAASDVCEAQKRAEKLIVCAMPMMMLAMYACMIAVAWFGGHYIIQGTMFTGELVSFLSYITQILSSLMMVSFAFVSLVISKASVNRIVEIIEEKVDISDVGADRNLKVANGDIVFDHVNFSYARDPENLTLEDVNLTIKSGETVGIIGGTGSAKSTLVSLIPRLYDVYSGSVKVGGHDVREYGLTELRDSVAMVLQKNVLFSGTIRDNLKWGNADATDEEIAAACRAAQADEFIRSFPDGYDTDLGQGGVNVSGGQKQRLCIARALLKHPKIIILDDSTSAVDTATDAKIRDCFKSDLGDTTTIIIAQRVASVKEADKIIVLEDGKINAVGTHEELLASNEIYREVYQSQNKEVA